MAKVYGLQGVLTGKVGNTVFAVRNGKQIARQFQPVVLNPKSTAQQGVRAKLKLISQLSAMVGDYIAIPKEGDVTSRNMFTKVNYPLATYANNEAGIVLENVQLTKSLVSISGLTATRASGGFAVQINANASLDRVVYVCLVKKGGNLLFGGAITKSADSTHEFRVTVPSTDVTQENVILAYGVRLASENARSIYSNIEAVAGETTGKVVVSAMLRSADVIPTMTIGTTVAQAE